MNDQLRKMLDDFDFNKPDWSLLPDNFPKCDLGGLRSGEVGCFNAIRGLWELEKASLPQKPRSRVWTEANGFERLAVWQNASLLRVLVRKFTATLPKSEYRAKAQLDDAARSIKRNIEEGWKRATTSEYLQFLSYSQGSLEEVKGDIRDAKTDGFLKSRPESSLRDIGIDLCAFKGKDIKGAPEDEGHRYYEALMKTRGEELTFEMFLELANKTDWLFRQTVKSLEDKLIRDKKFYELEQARIKSNLKFR